MSKYKKREGKIPVFEFNLDKFYYCVENKTIMIFRKHNSD